MFLDFSSEAMIEKSFAGGETVDCCYPDWGIFSMYVKSATEMQVCFLSLA